MSTSRLVLSGCVGRARFIKRIGILLILVWWAMPQSAPGADIGNFSHYGVDDGLPQSQVRVIHQDARGYLWIGTQGGLGRFNGREFKRYSSADGLAGNQIESIMDDGAGGVWVGTNVGLCRFEDDSFECNQSARLRGRSIHAMATARDRLWLGTDRGLIQLRPADMSVVDVRFPQQSIPALSKASNDVLFVGTDAGLIALDLVSGVGQPIDFVDGTDPAIVSLRSIGQRLWVGTGAGLFLCELDAPVGAVDPKRLIVTDTNISGIVPAPDGGLMYGSYRGLYQIEAGSQEVVSRVPELGEEIIRTLFLDREGIIWIGHDNGLSKLTPTRFLGHDRDRGLLADFVRTLAQDAAGRLWLGTRVGVQVVPLRADGPALDESFTLTRADGLPNDRIYAIEFPPAGGALLATNGGVVHWREDAGVSRVYSTLDGLPHNQVRSLRRDSLGRIWIGTSSGVAVLENGRLVTDLPDQLSDIYALNILEDDRGWLWFATRDHGLLQLSPEGAVTRLDASDGVSDQTLWDLAPADRGGMWVGTNGDGLFRIRSDGSVAAHLTERDGLANDFVWSVIVDDQGHVWAYTTRGLSRYDGTDFVTYGKGDGLLHLEGGATGSLQTRDGQLWFASVGGLMQFKPRQNPGDVAPPPVLIESATVDGIEIKPGARLPPDYSEITFEYAALSFQSGTGTRYRYQIDGLNSDWIDLNDYRPVTVARLGPGDYEFRVIGSNASGAWSREPARFAFSVAAPVWLRPWFIAVCALALAGLVISAWRFRVHALRRRALELEHMVGERTHELEQANRRLSLFANTDPLTGLKNRRFLMEQIGHDVAQCLRRTRKPGAGVDEAIGFLLIDLDDFKRINDTHGHQAGDAVLQQIAQVLLRVARESDYVIRWGGDEFLVVARRVEPDAGHRLAQRVVEALRDTSFVMDKSGKMLTCRCSVGLCSFPFTRRDPEAVGWEQVVEIADVAAYLAKRGGGNRWVEIVRAGSESVEAQADYLREIRANAERLEASGRIRIRRGEAGDDS